MKTVARRTLTDIIGAIPYRMAFVGGWIDLPFVSRRNPARSGSMVVVGLEPTCWFMERAGMATGTRNVAVFFGTLDRTGTVEAGKRADLLLLEGDPLADIRNTARLAGVMLGGRWLPRSEIDARLSALGAP